ncbi:MAG: carbamoyltransferase HypF, partial [Planctomycetota bacterium]
MNVPRTNGSLTRLRICIDGAVQGVGFRPFVYRLARGLDLKGWVENSPQGVTIEVEGPRTRLHDFRRRVVAERPPLAEIRSCRAHPVAIRRSSTFEIRRSAASGEKTAIVLPDIATCADCLRDISDPGNRRYRYPFTNCTNCGPRFSIIESLPYDRPRTSMRLFEMCGECRREYEDPADRRFHAQPNACPVCGPHLELWDPTGNVLEAREDALIAAADA